MEFGMLWVHMARYELILRLDGALWLRIISKTPLTPRRAMKIRNPQKTSFFLQGRTPPRYYSWDYAGIIPERHTFCNCQQTSS